MAGYLNFSLLTSMAYGTSFAFQHQFRLYRGCEPFATKDPQTEDCGVCGIV